MVGIGIWIVHIKKQKIFYVVHDFEEKADMETNNYKTVKNVPLWKDIQRMLGCCRFLRARAPSEEGREV